MGEMPSSEEGARCGVGGLNVREEELLFSMEAGRMAYIDLSTAYFKGGEGGEAEAAWLSCFPLSSLFILLVILGWSA